MISPHVSNDIEPWLADVITPPFIEVIEIVDLPFEIAKVVDFSEVWGADHTLQASTTLNVAVLDDNEGGQDALTWMDQIADAVHHVCIYEDYQDALAWMSRIADALYHVCAYELITPHSTAEEAEEVLHLNEEQKVALALRNEIHAQADVFQGRPVSHAPIDIEETLAYLVNERGNPTFNDGDTSAARGKKWYENCRIEGGEFFYDMNTSVASHNDWEDCSMGHSFFVDAIDTSFMLNDLEDQLPAKFVEEFEHSPFESRYGGRDHVAGGNFWHYRLCEQWHAIKTANIPRTVRNHGDVITAEHARVKRSTPACPDIERGVDGPCSHSRPYLNYTEECIIKIGIAEYIRYCDYEIPKLSQMQKNFEARSTDTQSLPQNHVLNWLFSME